MPKYLEKRRRRWFAVLDVPKDVRPKFGGLRRLVRSLETESLTEAETRVHRVIGGWKEEIAVARHGRSAVKPDLVKEGLVWREDLRKVAGQVEDEVLVKSLLDDKLWDIDHRDREGAQLVAKLAYGETYPLDRDIDSWIAAQDVAAKTKDMKRSDAKRFALRFKFSDQVTRQSLLHWVQALQAGEQLKAATIRRILSACRGYWDYLQLMGHITGGEKVFDGVSPKKVSRTKGAPASKRRAFLPDEITRLLVAALDRDDLELARLIWLAMWTGCRIEELCSLRVSDVHESYFAVTDSKTEAGIRTVPIHTRLAPLMRHLCAISSDGYVISGLPFNKYDGRSNAPGKRFGRLKSSMGFGPSLVFHSIRKTVTTLLENAGVPENVTADLVGHEKNTITYGLYSGGNQLPVLRDAIEKLSYSVDPKIEGRLLHKR